MRNTLLGLTSAGMIMLGAASPAHADMYDESPTPERYYHPYIGVDYTSYDMFLKGGSDSGGLFSDDAPLPGNVATINGGDRFQGWSPYIGLQMGRYIGLELGYFQTGKEQVDFVTGIPGIGNLYDGSYDIEMKGYTSDLVLFLPLEGSYTFNLLATGGVAYYMIDKNGHYFNSITSQTAPISEETEHWGFRVGLGAQVNIMDTLGIRGVVRYNKLNLDDDLNSIEEDNFITYSGGVNVKF